MARATVALLVMIGCAAALEWYAPTTVLIPNPSKLLVLLFSWSLLLPGAVTQRAGALRRRPS